MRIILYIILSFLFVPSIYSQGSNKEIPNSKHKYSFKIPSSQTLADKKETVDIIRNIFNTNFSKYSNNKKAFVLALDTFMDVNDIKSAIENEGFTIDGNVTYLNKPTTNYAPKK